jgi:hypothetical protein
MDLALSFEAPLVLGRALTYRSLTSDGGPEPRQYLRGMIRDAHGAPLDDVTVILDSEPVAWTRTNHAGQFTLRVPSTGRVGLQILTPDGSSKSIQIEVPAGPFEFQLD